MAIAWAAGPVEKTDTYYKWLPNLRVAQLLLEYLKLEGVRKLFGIPGATLAYLLHEIATQSRDRPDRIEFVVCRHESGAVYIAHGYAIVTGKPGVVLAGAGPGATNALTGALNAQANGAAVLVITGEVDQQFFGCGHLQEGVEPRPYRTCFAENLIF